MTRENVVNKLVPIIQSQSCLTLKMVHFYVDAGIDDKGVYIDQLKKVIELYTFLKPSFEELDSLNIGGGMPINQSLTGSNDYDLLIRKILSTIKLGCNKNNVLLPNLYSEFGKYTVGESCTTIYSVLEEKTQDDSESWYMLDNSIINLLPDVWANKQQYIVLPLNLWGSSYKEVILGGLTCDGADFYNSSTHGEPLMMPYLSDKIDRLYVAFIHTGAYQDSLSGIGGVNHCLLPSHKILFVDRAKNDELNEKLIDLNDDLLHPLAILGYV